MKVRGIALLAVAALLVGACGSRAETSSEDPDDDGLPENPTTETAGADIEEGKFGTVDSPCGPTPDGMTLTASDQGVFEDRIEVGTISDPGGPVPGGLGRRADGSPV